MEAAVVPEVAEVPQVVEVPHVVEVPPIHQHLHQQFLERHLLKEVWDMTSEA